MTVINVALLGLGTVGQGVLESIQSHQQELRKALGAEVVVQAVLVKDLYKTRNVSNEIVCTTSFDDILELEDIDVVVEAIVGREPAFTYLKKAIAHGCHIVTANKVMFAHHGQELLELARKKGVHVGYEAAVAGGIPILRSLSELLRINRIEKLEGILNGTSNYILTEIREKKLPFETVLQDAQAKGYAEADPATDIEGHDAFYKLMILSQLLFGEQPEWTSVPREGITRIDQEQIELAEELGLRFRHMASLQPSSNGLNAKVTPAVFSQQHPFFHVDGVDNAVSVKGSLVGRLTFQGPGAGKLPTASAIVEDLTKVLCSPLERMAKPPIHFNEENDQSEKQWLLLVPHWPSLPSPFITSGKLVRQVTGPHWKAILFLGDEKTVTAWKDRLPMIRLYEIFGGQDWKVQSQPKRQIPSLNALAF